MKQLPLTPDLIAKIQAVAGVDVVTEGLAVFEAIAVNTLPLPGKNGSLFEKAVMTPLTLREMADYINTNGLPLAEDHITSGAALGRVFNAEFNSDTSGPTIVGQLRTLFYLDPTETVRITKLNAGVIDEVSVNFLGAHLLCSECGWDYRSPEADGYDNIYLAKCANGHAIGEDGTHLIVSGLEKFTELSLVQLGAASKAKIVGKSDATLTPQSLQIAAKNFEAGQLFLTASAGEHKVDFEAILSKLTAASAENATLSIGKAASDAQVVTLTAALAASDAQVVTLTASLAEAATAKDVTVVAELAEARAVLTAQFTALAIADNVPDAPVPDTVAELKAGIEARTSKLTALIPIGGAALKAGGDVQTQEANAGSAFKLAK